MIVAEYIAGFLVKKNITHVFELSGGMITYLLDEIYKTQNRPDLEADPNCSKLGADPKCSLRAPEVGFHSHFILSISAPRPRSLASIWS